MSVFQSTNPERQRKLEILREMWECQDDGAFLSWLEIQQLTDVPMYEKGKAHTGNRQLARRALDSRPYASSQGTGIELSSPENAIQIVEYDVKRIRRGIRRAKRRCTSVIERHGEQLNEDDQRKVRMLQSFYSAASSLSPSTIKRSNPVLSLAPGEKGAIG